LLNTPIQYSNTAEFLAWLETGLQSVD
jgi:hypothetical protein